MFRTKEQAIKAMEEAATQYAVGCGYPEDEALDGFETSAFNSDVPYHSSVHGYFPDGWEWKLVEVPGAFIPQDACDSFNESIREASEMYQDEERMDYYDADDICQQVCWDLESYI